MKKLKLGDLELKSFVTTLNEKEKNTVDGGTLFTVTNLTVLFTVISPCEPPRPRQIDSNILGTPAQCNYFSDNDPGCAPRPTIAPAATCNQCHVV